jgi:WD40 repeat protein/serine/threonine protein kinase
MDPQTSDRDPVEELAEEFVERYRRGERPSLQEYTDRCPAEAERIRALFPALVVMEKVRPDPAEGTRAGGRAGPADVRPERLGDYRILREVGRGGMGVVFEAEQESLGRHVALKVLPLAALLDPRHLQRFKREARAAARLHHTNIVPVHGVGEHDGMHYYVMQFIQGQGLDQVLAELQRLRQARPTPADPAETSSAAAVARSLLTGPGAAGAAPGAEAVPACGTGSVHLPGQAEGSSLSEAGRQYWHSVARIGLQVADALHYASGQGILHRDIKPSNLLLDTRGTVWVTDFGLAKAETDHDNVTHTGDIVGTLRYMAPERFQGHADVRSDLYALGLTLYELLTLRPAFDETDRNKLMTQVIHDQPPRPRQVNRSVPRDLETVVLKATAREPAQRYQTPAELADDLQRYLDDRPIKARRLGVPQRVWRWYRRNPVLASLGGAIALLVLVIAVGSPVMLLNLQDEQAHTLKQLHRAEKAEKDANDRLRDSYLAQAQARRWSGKPGRHFQSLEALSAAAALRPALDLRNEAIACIPLVDLRVARKWDYDELGPFTINCVFDARMQHLAAADSKGTIRVRRVADGAETARLPGVGFGVNDIQFSADGQLLVARHGDNEVRAWALDRAECLLRLPMPPGPSGYHAQVLTPDGRRLLIGLGDRSLRIHELPSGKELRRFVLKAAVTHMALHPDGEKLAVSTWNRSDLEVLDLETGAVLSSFRHPGSVTGVSWHPGGTLLAATCGFNVHVWNVETGKPHCVLVGHQTNVLDCSFNHGGDLLASTGWDNTTRLWDVSSGKELVSIPGTFTRFSTDDRFLAYAHDTEAGIWDVATGRECRTFHAFGQAVHGPWSVEFQPGGRLLATANDDGVRVWDTATGKLVETLPVGYSRVASFGPAGDWLISSSERGILRWPLAADPRHGVLRVGPPATVRGPLPVLPEACLSGNGRRLARLTGPGKASVIDLETAAETALADGHAKVSHVAISPDGCLVVTGTQHGSGLKVWDAGSGQLVRDLPAGTYGRAAFAPDGRWLVTTSAGEGVHIREVGTWAVRHQLTRKNRTSSGLAISPDSSLLAVALEVGTVSLFDPVKGDEVARLPSPIPLSIGNMCFNDDGSQLALACYNHHTVQVWDLRAVRARLRALKLDWDLPAYPPARDPAVRQPLEVEVVTSAGTLRCLRGHKGAVSVAAVSPDGTTLVSAGEDGAIRLRDWPGGKLRRTLQDPNWGILRVAFSADGKVLASGNRRGRVVLWDVANGKRRLVLDDHSAAVEGVAFSADGNLLATASHDRTVKVRDAATGKVRWTGKHDGAPVGVAFSRDGKTLVSGGGDWNSRTERGEVRIWDVATGKELLKVPGKFGGVWDVALSADGKLLAGGCLDGTVRLWDAATGKEQFVLRGHTERVLCVAFAQGDRVLVSSSHDGTVRLWDVASGEQRAVALRGPAVVNRFNLSPDGQVLATSHGDGTVQLSRFPAAVNNPDP